jgi:hypothetical protein
VAAGNVRPTYSAWRTNNRSNIYTDDSIGIRHTAYACGERRDFGVQSRCHPFFSPVWHLAFAFGFLSFQPFLPPRPCPLCPTLTIYSLGCQE